VTVARVTALIPDLLFGSKAAGLLGAAGHDVTLAAALPEALDGIDVVVVDLTQGLDPEPVVAARGDARLLGVFSHVEPEVRARALAAGFDQVVPRSRFMRDGGELVTALAQRA
jgi:hypothetical protein